MGGPLSGISKQKLSRAGMAVLAAVAIAAIGWLAMQATGRRESVVEARQAREHTLQVGAKFAASEIRQEIDLRFDILTRVAADDDLRQQMDAINNRPKDTDLLKRLENWLGARKSDNDNKADSDSWFIDDALGVQVARSPRSETSRGENYAYRDYFHGQGNDLSPEIKNLKPIKSPHLSAVYRSSSTGRLKVAFSVPIGRKAKPRDVIGVLAMTVDLGAFNVLEKQLPTGLEVVLIDLRPATINGQTNRGLILHRQTPTYREGQPPPWIGADVLDRIDKMLGNADAEGLENGALLTDYTDNVLTGGRHFWGALQPVTDGQSEEPSRGIRWVVLVQEPVGK